MIRNRILVAAVAVLVAVGAAQLAAQDDGVPLDVQIIIAKAAAGMPPTDTEQQRLHEYATQDQNAPVNGVTLGDVIAIIDTAKKTGEKPPAAEIAKMRQWAAGMKQQKQKMIDDAKKFAKALEGANKGGKGGGAPKPDNHSGKVHFVVHETAKDTGKDSSGSAAFDFDATFPVRFDVKETNGDLTVSWMPDMNSTDTITGSYQVQSSSTKSGYSGTTKGGGGISVSAKSGSFTMGAVASLKAGARPYLRGSASTTATVTLNTHEVYGNPPTAHDSTQQMPAVAPAPASLDDVAVFDSPFCPVANVPEAYKKMALDEMKKNMDPAVTAAAQGASCTFDGEGFRKQWAAGNPFTTSVTYHYTITKQKDGGSSTATFNTEITLTLGPVPADLDIIPGQAAAGADTSGKEDTDTNAYRNWLPRPYLTGDEKGIDIDKVAKAFKVQKKDRTATISFCAMFHPKAGGGDLPKGKIKFELKDVSNNAGLCTNYPPRDAQPQTGLYFPTGDAGDGKKIQEDDDKLDIAADGQSATTKDGHDVSAVTIRVAARDAGAWGTLVATCPDKNYTGVWKLNGKQAVPIPEDDNGNHVAVHWGGKGHDAGWDEDSQPADQREKGDGLTLYEEYRGFMVLDDADPCAWKHVRTDPDKKDVFCYDKDQLIKKYYFPENPSQLVWHFVNTDLIRFTGKADDPDNRWINPNTPNSLQYARQYGIYAVIDDTLQEEETDENGKTIMENGKPKMKPYAGGAEGIPGVKNQFENPIRDTYVIQINTACVGYGFDGLANLSNYKNDPAKLALIPQDKANYLKSTVCHEVGHYLGIHHHRPPFGEPETSGETDFDYGFHAGGSRAWGCYDCCMRYSNEVWDIGPVQQGNVLPCITRYCRKNDNAFGPPDGKKETYADNCWGQIKVRCDPK